VGVEKQVLLPDIGEFENVDVIEILVSVGDRVAVDDSLIVLESDKATMEIPSPFAGTLKEICVSEGDLVSQGALIAIMEVEEAEASESVAPSVPAAPPEPEAPQAPAAPSEPAPVEADPVQPASKPEPVEADPLQTATEPAPVEADPLQTATEPAPVEADPVQPASKPEPVGAEAASALPAGEGREGKAHASPSVRRLARELGVDLRLVAATGRKGRIRKEDVQGYVKGMLAKGTAAGVPIAGVSVAAPREIDFSKYGPTELQPLNRVRKLSAANLHRSWVTVPHVTQFDEADITDLDVFRTGQKPAAESRGIKLTFLPFVVKACAAALKEFPHFNSSLDHTGENLIVKRYVHIGVAVDTPNGLVVPVLRDADRKGLFQIAEELQELGDKARNRKLRPEELEGGSFSISSLGGIGGTFFTPIVNHPEVAVLGVSRMEWKPIRSGDEFVPRLILPLSLSYDHRVIDGADAVRFTRRLAGFLSDLRLLLL
jgi:pyruvate dehydrogenase E2 component (dihydrolipoamide acetyltransferase)